MKDYVIPDMHAHPDFEEVPPKSRGAVRSGERKLDASGLLAITAPHQPEENEELVLLTLLIGTDDDDVLRAEYERQREWIYGHLEPHHFHFRNPSFIYSACKKLHDDGLPVTLTSVQGALTEEGYSQELLDDMMYSVARAARNMEYGEALAGQHWASKIINASVTRNALIDLVDEAREIGAMGTLAGASTVRAAAKKLQDRCAQYPVKDVPQSLSETGTDGIFRRLEELAADPSKDDAVPTGFSGLDRALDGGVRGGESILIGGRPGTGKSSLALGAAFRMALAGKRILYVSLEMSRAQLEQRLLAMASGVGLSRLRHPDGLSDAEWDAVYGASPLLDIPLHIDDSSGLTPSKIEEKAAEMKNTSGLDAVFVDYLQILRPDGRSYSRENEVAAMSGAMKAMAMKLGIPVFVLVQLNRALEGRDSQMPQLSDLRESGSLEQDADTVILLARDMKAAFAAARRGLSDSIAMAIIAKQRSGSVGAVRMLYRGATTSYVDLGLRMA